MTQMRKEQTNMERARSIELDGLFARLMAVLCELPVTRRAPRDRQRCGGRLHPMHEMVVEQVRWGLEARPEMFPDVPGAAGVGLGLAERQARAGVWLAMRDQLRVFAEVCQDEAIREQGQAAQEAGQVVEQVLGGLREGRSGLNHRARLSTILMGLVWRRESLKNGGRPTRRPGPGPGPGNSEGERELTPRQAQAAEARRQDRVAELRAIFGEWMRRGRG